MKNSFFCFYVRTKYCITNTFLFVCIASHSYGPASYTLSRLIPNIALKRLSERTAQYSGLCVGRAAHELFVADSANRCVRLLDVRAGGRLDANDVYRCEDGEVLADVAYNAVSDSLFVATRVDHPTLPNIDPLSVLVRSFGRTTTDDRWIASRRLHLAADGSRDVCLRVLRDGTLFCGQTDAKHVNVCRVHPNLSMPLLFRVVLSTQHEYMQFDAQLLANNEKRLAAALKDWSVVLFRLDADRAVELSRIEFNVERYRITTRCSAATIFWWASGRGDASFMRQCCSRLQPAACNATDSRWLHETSGSASFAGVSSTGRCTRGIAVRTNCPSTILFDIVALIVSRTNSLIDTYTFSLSTTTHCCVAAGTFF